MVHSTIFDVFDRSSRRCEFHQGIEVCAADMARYADAIIANSGQFPGISIDVAATGLFKPMHNLCPRVFVCCFDQGPPHSSGSTCYSQLDHVVAPRAEPERLADDSPIK